MKNIIIICLVITLALSILKIRELLLDIDIMTWASQTVKIDFYAERQLLANCRAHK